MQTKGTRGVPVMVLTYVVHVHISIAIYLVQTCENIESKLK